MGSALRKSRNETAEPETQAQFLGVINSARGLEWTSRLDTAGVNLATAIAQQHGLPDMLARVLTARGATLETVPVLLAPSIKALMPDPSTLVDMDKAAARIADAVVRKEAVAIFGDYDVDGACSAALLARFLNAHGVATRIYIPDRIAEGYGPNAQAIAQLVREGAQLIVTVDCGSTSHVALAAAEGTAAKPGKKSKSDQAAVDVVVLDHHQADEHLPAVHAIVNPNRQDDLSGLGHLCAAGVVFMTLVATARHLKKIGHVGTAPDLLSLLDMVALATVCDVVPLQGLNRAFVAKGLQVMRARHNLGLRALADAAGLNTPPTPYHLGFLLGPRINAGGRIGDAALGARLLTTDDAAEAERIAQTLDRLNRERKAMETVILEEALARADADLMAQPDMPLVIAGSKEWHKGLVGLVASRLTERFGRPSCVIAWTETGEGTGSLRSIAGVDIGAAVRAAVAEGLLIKGGGHAMAAGLTVAESRLEELRTFLATRLGTTVERSRERAGLMVDGALTAASAHAGFLDQLDQAGPFGQGNPTPRYVFPAHRVRGVRIMGANHLRCTFEGGDGTRFDGVAFRAIGTPLGDLLQASLNGLPIHVAGSLRRDTWNGRERIELAIDDAADPRKQG
jgi:single-stranded-DNA-specific exonuclease